MISGIIRGHARRADDRTERLALPALGAGTVGRVGRRRAAAVRGRCAERARNPRWLHRLHQAAPLLVLAPPDDPHRRRGLVLSRRPRRTVGRRGRRGRPRGGRTPRLDHWPRADPGGRGGPATPLGRTVRASIRAAAVAQGTVVGRARVPRRVRARPPATGRGRDAATARDPRTGRGVRGSPRAGERALRRRAGPRRPGRRTLRAPRSADRRAGARHRHRRGRDARPRRRGHGQDRRDHRQGRPPRAQRGGAARGDPRAGVQRRRRRGGAPAAARRPQGGARVHVPRLRPPRYRRHRRGAHHLAPRTGRRRVPARGGRGAPGPPRRLRSGRGGHGLHRAPPRAVPVAVQLQQRGRVLRLRAQRGVAHAQRRPREERRGVGDRQLPHPERHRVPLRAGLPGADRHARPRAVPARLLPPHPRHLHRALRARRERPTAAGMEPLRRGRRVEARHPRRARHMPHRDVQLAAPQRRAPRQAARANSRKPVWPSSPSPSGRSSRGSGSG